MTKPLIFIDIESTGVDVVNDRIVQLAALKVTGGIEQPGEEKNVLIYPGIVIPKEAIECHGITNEMVIDKPRFSQYAKGLFDFLKDSNYAGFNIIQFDIPLLSEEFARCGIDWPAKDALFFDAFHVFREKEKRDLSSAVKFYCNQDHTEAHDAVSDCRATRNVLLAQIERYPDLDSEDKYAEFCKNPNALDLAGKIVLNDNGHAVYNFGKDKGKVIKYNPSFGKWMLNNSFPTNTKNIIRSLIGEKTIA